MTGRIAAVLVVPHGTHRPEALAAAVAAVHPTWEVGATWCGDPHLRPCPDGVAWFDTGGGQALAESAIISGEPSIGEWRRATATAAERLADGVDRVVLLWVGATAVLSPLDALVSAGSKPMTLVPHSRDAIPADGLAPTEADLIADGLYSTTVAVFTSDAQPALEWLAANLGNGSNVGQVLSCAAQIFGADECSDESIGVGRWRWNGAPSLLDVAEYEAASPWTLDANAQSAMRIELLGNPERQQVIARAAEQLAGERTALCLPGGLAVDAIIRQVVADSSELPPAPWSAAAEFRAWLAPRYWRALHDQRADLRTAFPDPEGRSAESFRTWCRGAFSFDDVPLLLNSPQYERSAVTVAERLRDRRTQSRRLPHPTVRSWRCCPAHR